MTPLNPDKHSQITDHSSRTEPKPDHTQPKQECPTQQASFPDQPLQDRLPKTLPVQTSKTDVLLKLANLRSTKLIRLLIDGSLLKMEKG